MNLGLGYTYTAEGSTISGDSVIVSGQISEFVGMAVHATVVLAAVLE